ncbi:hypothetical protein COLU111180_04230 [Cohnella lubricantis]|uniref:Uncharacterized protein n=1 Tax=Cohnella lubricantis TaxID=2163172 RepID=A0A841T8V7_9BACL|nr:hypothetical protein [Cohnella lubricantis]MBB6676486.1 hypothetical protein [Cohnella lubricantis]MBP2117103.1 hypothetical protein [Cohnella lubricantis]
MPKMGICSFSDGGIHLTDFVAPKADYPDAESFVKACKFEFDYEEDGDLKYEEKIKVENVKEGHCRWYPVAPEGCDIDGGCYSFSKPGPGAFPVWYIPLQ